MQEKDFTTAKDFVPTPPESRNQFENAPSITSKIDNITDAELGPRATYINTGAAAGLSQEHRDYLLARHGTLDLDPIPDMGDQDPFNWPQWKVINSYRSFSMKGHADKSWVAYRKSPTCFLWLSQPCSAL